MDKITIIFNIKGTEFKEEVEIADSKTFAFVFEKLIEHIRLNVFERIIDYLRKPDKK